MVKSGHADRHTSKQAPKVLMDKRVKNLKMAKAEQEDPALGLV